MAMSRKDYVKFAALFAGEMALAKAGPNPANTLDTLRNVIYSSADIFAQDNPRFDRDRFYTACGVN